MSDSSFLIYTIAAKTGMSAEPSLDGRYHPFSETIFSVDELAVCDG
jgi:hypothetical protein